MPLLTIDQAKQILNLIIKTKRDFNALHTGPVATCHYLVQ